MWLLNTNYADLSFLFSLRTGEPENRHLGEEYLAILETEFRDALLLESPLPGHRPHDDPGRDRIGQEFLPELPADESPEIPTAHLHLRSGRLLREPDAAVRGELSAGRDRAAILHDQSVPHGADPRESPLPVLVRSRADRVRRLSADEPRRARSLRAGRERLRRRPRAAAAVHPGQYSQPQPIPAPAEMGARRPVRSAVRQRRGQPDLRPLPNLRLRRHGQVPAGARTLAVLHPAPGERFDLLAGASDDLQSVRHGRSLALPAQRHDPALYHRSRQDLAQTQRRHDPGDAVKRRLGELRDAQRDR